MHPTGGGEGGEEAGEDPCHAERTDYGEEPGADGGPAGGREVAGEHEDAGPDDVPDDEGGGLPNAETAGRDGHRLGNMRLEWSR